MTTIKLREHLAATAARKAALGMSDAPEEVAAMRNPGGSRTREKRAMLRKIDARAKAAGKTPFPSF